MVGVKRKISEVDGGNGEGIPSVKDLASSEPRLRRECLQSVLSHIESRSHKSHISATQALQLWRGFYVALYMHDSKSAISVQNLITQLAGTFSLIRSKDEEVEAEAQSSRQNGETTASDKSTKEDNEWNGLDDDDNDNDDSDSEEDSEESNIDSSWLSTYSTAFWQTMIREWPNIDSHRMNKYLLLVRTITRELFTICLKAQIQSQTSKPHTQPSTSTTKKSKSNSKSKSKSSSKSDITTTTSTPPPFHPTPLQSSTLLTSQLSILSLHPLHPRNSKVPNGLKLHMLDIYIDELYVASKSAQSLTTTSTSTTETPNLPPILKQMMTPVEKVAKDGLAKNVRVRAKEEVLAFEERKGERELDGEGGE